MVSLRTVRLPVLAPSLISAVASFPRGFLKRIDILCTLSDSESISAFPEDVLPSAPLSLTATMPPPSA